MSKLLEKWMNPNVASVKPYEPGRPIEEVARELGLDPATICKIASNENPIGTSPKAIDAMHTMATDMYRYPDGGAFYLRTELARRFGVGMPQIVLGNGSNELIEFIGHCFMAPGRSIVCSAHAFVIYKLIARMMGSEVIEVPTCGLGHDLNAMAEAVREDTSVVFVCNPNNPTGTLLCQDELEEFVERIPDSTLIVFDEAYAEIAQGEMPDMLETVKTRPNCVMLRTFSKAYGLAGLRIGYGICPAAVAEALQKARQPFNANRMAQTAALAALDDDEFLMRTNQLIAEGKQYMENAFVEMGLEFQPTAANFILVRVGDGAKVTTELTKRGVIVRPMAGYGLGEYIRVSFGAMDENRRFIGALKEVL